MTITHTQEVPKFVTGLFMSLDGIVEADEDWQFAYFDDELFAGIAAGWARAGVVLMGRHSFAGYDRLRNEHPDSPAVQFLNSVPKYVASTTLTEVGWSGTTVLGVDLEAELARLRTEPGKDILVLGSPTLVRWLISRRLLDALTFTVLPIIVGSGVRLFEDMELPTGHLHMRLDTAQPLSSGALELRYQVRMIEAGQASNVSRAAARNRVPPSQGRLAADTTPTPASSVGSRAR